MSFFFRKSVRLGPIRLNLSKSGIGASIGVKGARITASATGSTYVTVGSHGFYYRQTLPRDRQNEHIPQQPSHAQPGSEQSQGPSEMPTADVSQLVDSSSTNLVDQLNERARISNPAPLFYIGSVVIVFLALSTGQAAWLLGTVVLGFLG